MKKNLALFISVCMLAAYVNPLFVAADSVTEVNDVLSTSPYKNEYGLMANAIELSERFSLEYEFDEENKAFIICDDEHGEIMLMHNATEFYSGDRVYQCQPYFYVENGVPMIEVGFFCDMFMSSYEYDEKTGEISFDIGKMRYDAAKIVKDGNVIPMYMTPFYDSCGLMVSAEDMAKAFGVSYKFDGAKVIVDGEHEFEETAEYSYFKIENEQPFIEAGYFADLFGYSYVYDEEMNTLEITERAVLMDSDTSVISGTIVYDGTTKSKVVVEFLLQQTALKKEGVPAAGGTVGEVYSLGEITLTQKSPEAEYSFDVSEYVSDEYGTYTLFYKTDNACGYYTKSGGVIPISTAPEDNTIFYPLARHFEFSGEHNADIVIGKSGLIEGKVRIADNSKVTENSIAVKLYLRSRTSTRYSHYGYTYYSHGTAYELGTTTLKEGNTERTYKYDTAQYYNDSYPCYTLMYKIEGESDSIYPFGYCNNNGKFSATTENAFTSKITFSDSKEFHTNEYAVVDVPVIKTSGVDGDMEWNLNLLTGELTVSGSGTINSNVPWYAYRSMITSINTDGDIVIGSRAFDGCSKLASISMNGNTKVSGQGIFKGCSTLENISLNCEITEIDNSMFEGCSALESIMIPQSVTKIGDNAFKDCTALKNVTIPQKVTSIGSYAFNNCGVLSSIELPAALQTVGDSAFEGCAQLNDIILPDSIVSIGSSAFKNCKNLSDIKMPKNLTRISDSLFNGCAALETVEIPETVTAINQGAFAGCKELDGIVIPENVYSIGGEAFYGCENLSNITLPQKLKAIGNWTFYKCYNITDIIIPDSVTVIGSNAFQSCKGLQNVTIGSKVEEIGSSAFLGCVKLNEVVLPETVKTIGDRAFNDCELIESITLPEGLNKLGAGAFQGCARLKNINIPSTLSSISSYAFYNCDSLNNVVVPGNIKLIADSAFGSCDSLRNITIEYGVKQISSYAFSFDPIEEIVLPNSVEEIYYGIFYGCAGLKNVVLSQRISSIPLYAFDGCSSLEEISIPRGVSLIENYAFSGCDSLEVITFEGGAPTIAAGGFANMPNVTVYYPESYVTSYTMLKNKYANYKWVSKGIYMIRFKNNGGEGTVEYQLKIFGEDLVLTDKIPTKPYYIFNGWATTAEATEVQYQPGEVITNNRELYLYAVWKPTVKLNASISTSGNIQCINADTTVPYENTNVYIAIYNKAGKLISAYKEESNKPIKVIPDMAIDCYKCKVMVWSDKMEPLCEKVDLIFE